MKVRYNFCFLIIPVLLIFSIPTYSQIRLEKCVAQITLATYGLEEDDVDNPSGKVSGTIYSMQNMSNDNVLVYIITVHHEVVEKYLEFRGNDVEADIEIRFFRNTEPFRANLVSYNPGLDLACLSVTVKNIDALPIRIGSIDTQNRIENALSVGHTKEKSWQIDDKCRIEGVGANITFFKHITTFGFSGGPLVDAEDLSLLGIIQEIDSERENTAYAINISDVRNFLMDTTFKLDVPENFSAIRQRNGDIRLSWRKNNNQNLWYIIERMDAQTGELTERKRGSAGRNSFVDKNINDTSIYNYRMYFYTEHGRSDYAEEILVELYETTIGRFDMSIRGEFSLSDNHVELPASVASNNRSIDLNWTVRINPVYDFTYLDPFIATIGVSFGASWISKGEQALILFNGGPLLGIGLRLSASSTIRLSVLGGYSSGLSSAEQRTYDDRYVAGQIGVEVALLPLMGDNIVISLDMSASICYYYVSNPSLAPSVGLALIIHLGEH